MFRGTHNFLNFCRIDVVATTNYERNITVANIEKVKYLGEDIQKD
jgi:tRNA U38,U39,U40 pseudouridine synthase TruA